MIRSMMSISMAMMKSVDKMALRPPLRVYTVQTTMMSSMPM